MNNTEAAESDFRTGSKMGTEFAQQAVKSNPYAKLCAAMVNECIKKS